MTVDCFYCENKGTSLCGHCIEKGGTDDNNEPRKCELCGHLVAEHKGYGKPCTGVKEV